VIAECHFVRIPRSADMREYIGATGGDITPSWVKVAAGGREGWVPARCLVHPSDLAVSRAMGPGPQSPAAAGRIDELVVATAAHPRNPGASRDPFGAAAEASDLPQMGEPLEALDSRADAAAQAAVAKANEPGDFSKGADMAESGLGFLGQRGVKQADDPKTKDAVARARSVAAIMDTVSRRRSLTQVDERLLGRACFTRVLGNVTPLAGDDAIVRYVNWIGDRVAAHSTNPFPAIALEFVVIPDYPANAIAIPGGPIVVSMGMLRELRSEDELAAVLGHAIAHVEERHGLGRAKSRRMSLTSRCTATRHASPPPTSAACHSPLLRATSRPRSLPSSNASTPGTPRGKASPAMREAAHRCAGRSRTTWSCAQRHRRRLRRRVPTAHRLSPTSRKIAGSGCRTNWHSADGESAFPGFARNGPERLTQPPSALLDCFSGGAASQSRSGSRPPARSPPAAPPGQAWPA
jgi:hypothetical protein